MKLEFNENEYCIDITLLPEHVEEMSQLLRFARNAKAEKPSVYMSFSNTPYCNFNLKKKEKKKQINSIIPMSNP